jgi:RNA polymerase sigma-70 factor (ECF subfamily)
MRTAERSNVPLDAIIESRDSAQQGRPNEGMTVRTSLVERARGGDPAAFDALVDLVGDRCLAIAYRITRDHAIAEDAVQQALISAWRELPRLRDPQRFDVWLQRLLVNACYQELRQLRRWKDRVAPLPIDGPAAADPYRSANDRDALDRAFRRLSPDRRAIFVLHHHAGLPVAEVAEIVGLPVGTVKSRLHYSTDILRAALAADERLTDSEALA